MPRIGTAEMILLVGITCLYSLIPVAVLGALYLIVRRLKRVEEALREVTKEEK